MKKLNVAVLYGGKSTEHEVSIHSAQTVCAILEKKNDKYTIYPIFIDKQGFWFLQKECGPAASTDIAITPVFKSAENFMSMDGKIHLKIDVIFPVLHGTNCEDGTMQGLFETLNCAYVGCGVLASAAGMDKEVSKIIANKQGVPVLPHKSVSREIPYDIVTVQNWAKDVGFPVFVKPVRLGSSIGVRKVNKSSELQEAIDFALKFDADVMIEKGIDHAREIFCALYKNGPTIKTSLCGELKALNSEFFDYNTKYLVTGGCETKVPANISRNLQDSMRADSEKIFRAMRGEGLARIDFLMDKEENYYFSEINTLPGMSNTSLYPQLFEASGENYSSMLDGLIERAISLFLSKKELSITR